jgi:hypothetical protein
MENSISISAVHIPTPASAESSLQISASDFRRSAAISSLPSAALSAAPRMYDALRKEKPNFCSSASVQARMLCGVTAPSASSILCQMVACALVEICCPTMDLTSAENKSSEPSRCITPILSIAAPSVLSRAFKWRISTSPYSIIAKQFASCYYRTSSSILEMAFFKEADVSIQVFPEIGEKTCRVLLGAEVRFCH